MSEKIGCHNCVGACCAGNTILELTAEERDHLRAGGSELVKIVDPTPYDREYVAYPSGVQLQEDGKPKLLFIGEGRKSVPLQANYGRYLMASKCGYLAVQENGSAYCSEYDNRPTACRDFEVGSDKCRFIRQLQGVDPWPEDALALVDLLEMLSSE